MNTADSPSPEPSGGSGFHAREILRLAWPLFQETLLRCLPLGILAAAASAVPEAEASASRAAGLAPHTREWWGVVVASTVLTLVCYDTVLRLQLAAPGRARPAVLESMRLSMAALPRTLVLLLLSLAPLLPPLWWIAVKGFGWVQGGWLLIGLAGLLFVFFAWPVQVAERASPWAALRRSILLVRVNFAQVATLAGVLLAAVLVFSQLTGIFIGIVMTVAGAEAQTSHAWLSVSRWLMACVLAVPMVYVGAVSATAYRVAARRQDQAPIR
ncbi:MAG TPA: hypothetical protein VEQ17_13870 [Steroidobacteraceae bacterium]|nr:hypothetical protein [Steroidobacteraceae bacterium]